VGVGLGWLSAERVSDRVKRWVECEQLEKNV
jgi:hypothetical protein